MWSALFAFATGDVILALGAKHPVKQPVQVGASPVTVQQLRVLLVLDEQLGSRREFR
jgi:hypothetical protein